MWQRRLRAIPALLIIGLALGACGGTRYGTVEHAYFVAPEHMVAAEANTIAFTVTGQHLDRTFEQFAPPLADMIWVQDAATSAYVVDLVVEATEYREEAVHVLEEKQRASSQNPNPASILRFTGTATMVAPYHVTVFDRTANTYLDRYNGSSSVPLTAESLTSEADVRAILKSTFHRQGAGLAIPAGNQAKQAAQVILHRLFEAHLVSDYPRIPQSHPREARIAQAYALLQHSTDPASATQALSIYQAIGTDTRTEKGELDTDLNRAVHLGLALCYRLLNNPAAAGDHSSQAAALK